MQCKQDIFVVLSDVQSIMVSMYVGTKNGIFFFIFIDVDVWYVYMSQNVLINNSRFRWRSLGERERSRSGPCNGTRTIK